MNYLKRWVFVFVFSALLATVFMEVVDYSVVVAHEDNHVAIYRNWGVRSVPVVYWSGGSFHGFTAPDSNGVGVQTTNDSMYLAHSFNESVAYNLRPYLQAIVWLLALSVFMFVFRGLG